MPAESVRNQDGLWGPVTMAQVKYFQSTHGLVADGIVGPNTWNTMIAANGSGIEYI